MKLLLILLLIETTTAFTFVPPGAINSMLRTTRVRHTTTLFVEDEASELWSVDQASEKAKNPLFQLSNRELKAMINDAGLSSLGLMEKSELVEVAAEAQKILADSTEAGDEDDVNGDKDGSVNEDTVAWKELDVVFYGRETCPWCVVAAEVCERRGIPTYLDVEKDPAAAAEFQKFPGNNGLPFFHSRKTGKTTAGWGRGATDLMFIVDLLK
jgi:hypothetical protein